MEKQEYKSKWDELVREIGVEVPPEIEQREQAVAATPAPEPKPVPIERESAASKVVVPKKTAVNWDALAGELGLPPAPPEEKQAEAKSEERPKIRETVRREPPQEVESRDEPPRRERSRRDESRPRREERSPREQRSEQREKRERSGPRREQRDEPRGERRPPRREPNRDREAYDTDRPRREEVAPRDEERAQQPPERPVPAREEPPKPPAVSLWHKIFGAPTPEPAERFIDEPEVPYTEPPSDFRDEPRDAGGFADAHADEPLGEARDDEFADDRGLARESSGKRDSSDRERGDRPRRRRGRGRGRRSESARGEEPNREQRAPRARKPERTSDSEQFTDDELEDELAIDEPVMEMDVDADDDGDGDDMEGGSRGRSTLQRAIPTWDEAIGFIVDSNMQTRSERRPPSRSGSRDNGGRGRPRGRRRPQ
jgi:hypothetical protein